MNNMGEVFLNMCSTVHILGGCPFTFLLVCPLKLNM
jgi:hypothetical protein